MYKINASTENCYLFLLTPIFHIAEPINNLHACSCDLWNKNDGYKNMIGRSIFQRELVILIESAALNLYWQLIFAAWLILLCKITFHVVSLCANTLVLHRITFSIIIGIGRSIHYTDTRYSITFRGSITTHLDFDFPF